MKNRWDVPEFDHQLIQKYDVPGPRYTSYPTAPHFAETFTSDTLQEMISGTQVNEKSNPLSLYFHLPYCKSVCYFCGCNVTFTKDRDLGLTYVETLTAEMDLLRSHLRSDRSVAQLHWGGGTPTFQRPETLALLWKNISKRFDFEKDAEMGVEIDPRETTPEHVEVLVNAGFNRFSMGIQDFDPRVQKAVHRVQPFEETKAVFDELRNRGVDSINVDLMYGLPFQTVSSYEPTLDRILEMNPDRLAVFNFAYLPTMIKHQKAIPEEALPSPGEKLAILELVIQRLTDAGYVYIGMDHFARATDELFMALKERTLQRNFQGYSTKGECDLIGFGATSISQVGPSYSQNLKGVEAYRACVGEGRWPVFRGLALSQEDLLRREIIFELMCHGVVMKDEISQKYGLDFDEKFGSALKDLQPMEEDGLIQLRPDRLEVRPLGRLLVRNLAMPFDAYLSASHHAYSRTV